ncbi:MAG: hypothetical protein DRQ44_16335 [Gammaproteobacteria bacterium]|nr:MAG: hypothetical protein DRQ44_16335 [Gammaproteobacteria bacterium]
MKKNKSKSKARYGISRIDDDIYNTHAWRVSLRRIGKMYVKNFPDKKCGGKRKALQLARQFRDELLVKYPPMTRKYFCSILRSNNKSGISGVYSYSKPYVLRDGTVKESWYWEANWPNKWHESVSARFSVKQYGGKLARKMAINAREKGLSTVKGSFWASDRGEVMLDGL